MSMYYNGNADEKGSFDDGQDSFSILQDTLRFHARTHACVLVGASSWWPVCVLSLWPAFRSESESESESSEQGCMQVGVS